MEHSVSYSDPLYSRSVNWPTSSSFWPAPASKSARPLDRRTIATLHQSHRHSDLSITASCIFTIICGSLIVAVETLPEETIRSRCNVNNSTYSALKSQVHGRRSQGGQGDVICFPPTLGEHLGLILYIYYFSDLLFIFSYRFVTANPYFLAILHAQ